MGPGPEGMIPVCSPASSARAVPGNVMGMAECLSGSDCHGGIYSIHSLDGCALVYLARLGADPVSQWPLSPVYA